MNIFPSFLKNKRSVPQNPFYDKPQKFPGFGGHPVGYPPGVLPDFLKIKFFHLKAEEFGLTDGADDSSLKGIAVAHGLSFGCALGHGLILAYSADNKQASGDEFLLIHPFG